MAASVAASVVVLACLGSVRPGVSAACGAPSVTCGAAVVSSPGNDAGDAAASDRDLADQGRGEGKGKARGQSKGRGHAQAGPDEDARLAVSIDRDLSRRRVSAYYQRQGLPPGLAKRGSLPPGLEKQLRERGQLPPGLEKHMSSLPPDLVRELAPLPDGYGWRLIGRNLVVLRLGSNVIAALIPGVIDQR